MSKTMEIWEISEKHNYRQQEYKKTQRVGDFQSIFEEKLREAKDDKGRTLENDLGERR